MNHTINPLHPLQPICLALVLVCLGTTYSQAQPLQADSPALQAWSHSYQREYAADLEGALAALQPLLAERDGAELAWLREGWLLYSEGKYNHAFNAYSQSLQHNSNSLDARLGMMLCRMAQKRWNEAEQLGQSALQGGDNYLLELRLLICTEALGQWQKLHDRALMLVSRYPGEADPWVFLARAQSRLGDRSGAQQSYMQVLRLSPGNQEARLFISPNA